MKVLITQDLFDIAQRLKGINANYKLYFNKATQQYQVYQTKGLGEVLAFVVPYDQLDARTLQYARYTSVCNAKQVFADIEKHNRQLEQAACKAKQWEEL